MKNLLKEFVDSKIPTNINYTNNNNYYNNNNYNNDNNDLTTSNNTNHCWSLQDPNNGVEIETKSLPLGEPIEKDIVSQNEGLRKLPQGWKYLKLDLFRNGTLKSGLPSYKMKAWISPKATTNLELVSLLNTPFESGRMKYNVNDDDWNTSIHWQTVRKHYHSIKTIYEDVRASKLAKTHKGAPTPIAVFVYRDGKDYGVDLVIQGKVYQYWFDTHLSDKQIKANQIGTIKVGHQQRAMLSWEDLGL